MAIVICNACNKEVSSSASVCPHCGQKLRRGCLATTPLFSLCVFSAFLMVGAVGAGSQTSNTPTDSKTQSSGPWIYDQTTDQMTGQVTRLACLNSTNQLQFGPPYKGGTTGRICLAIPVRPRKRQYGAYLVFQINTGQISCTVEGCQARFKIDDGKPFDVLGTESADGDPRFIIFSDVDQSSPMWKWMKKAKEIKIEVLYYQEGRQVLTFEPSQTLDPKW